MPNPAGRCSLAGSPPNPAGANSRSLTSTPAPPRGFAPPLAPHQHHAWDPLPAAAHNRYPRPQGTRTRHLPDHPLTACPTRLPNPSKSRPASDIMAACRTPLTLPDRRRRPPARPGRKRAPTSRPPQPPLSPRRRRGRCPAGPRPDDPAPRHRRRRISRPHLRLPPGAKRPRRRYL